MLLSATLGIWSPGREFTSSGPLSVPSQTRSGCVAAFPSSGFRLWLASPTPVCISMSAEGPLGVAPRQPADKRGAPIVRRISVMDSLCVVNQGAICPKASSVSGCVMQTADIIAQ